MRLALTALLLLSSTALGAQTAQSTSVGAQQVLAVRPLEGGACPVGFSATRVPGRRDLMQAHRGRDEAAVRATLHLLFTARGERALSSARVTFQGLAGFAVVPADAASAPDTKETLDLSLAADADHNFFSVAQSRKLTGVLSVQLDELRYADGTVWHARESRPCRVVPESPMLLGLLR